MSKYATLIATLVDTHLINATEGLSSRPLLSALGCRGPIMVEGEWTIVKPSTPDVQHETLVRDTLRHALRTYFSKASLHRADAVALMSGLSQKDRWRECLANSDDAYCLAALCITLGRDNLVADLRKLAGDTPGQLRDILGACLETETPPTEHPTSEYIACAFFGYPWYEICAEPVIHRRYLGEFVYLTRPPFSSDRCNYVVMALPALEAP